MQERNWDMYKYILESGKAVRNIAANQDQIFAGALQYLKGRNIEQIYILGSGTSYHASVAAKAVVEEKLGIKVFNMYPMEFVDNENIFNPNTLVIGISHGGRSSSTIRALDKARGMGLMTIAMTAEKERPIAEHGDRIVLIEIGEEHAGPKTKGYIGSIATIVLLGLKLAVQTGKITEAAKDEIVERMTATSDNIPKIAENAWEWYRNNAEDLKKCRRLIVLGCESCMSAMLEGTLKILEAVRYSVAGYELEEFMHGGYHSVNQDTYLLYLGYPGNHYERMVRMMDYFGRETGAHNYLITSDQNQNGKENFVFPFVNDPYFASMEYVVPLQVIARKLSQDLDIDCNISSDPQFHRKMGSYTY